MGSGRAMPHRVCFKRFTSLALQEKNTAAREMACLGAFTVIMRCIAMLGHAAMLVSCRAALLNERLAVSYPNQSPELWSEIRRPWAAGGPPLNFMLQF